MNKEAQRIAIAEAYGFKGYDYYPHYYPHGILVKSTMERRWKKKGDTPKHELIGRLLHDLPDPLNDLNAMHEYEETLTAHQWKIYYSELISIRWRDASEEERKGSGDDKALCPSRATAEQRAEAFLKTIGKWVDS